IELHRSEDNGVRKIVQELRALIEERCVVLVAFKDEVFAVAQLEAAAEILGDPADQKRRMLFGMLENPGEHRCRRRFAMGYGDYQHFFAAHNFVVQKLWQLANWNALIK